MKLAFSEKTDVGKVRELNEDSLGNIETSAGHFFLVCDGMGGHRGGDIASSLAVQSFKDYLNGSSSNLDDFPSMLENAVIAVNKVIFERSKSAGKLKGMGTTCVLLFINDSLAYYSNVGDSRLYFVRNKEIKQLTKDQSLVQQLVDRNIISEEEAAHHPRKNEILQALGLSDSVKPDTSEIPVNVDENDTFVLCSDGLYNHVNNDEILNIVTDNPPEDSCKLLINSANAAGGSDNISVQVIKLIK